MKAILFCCLGITAIGISLYSCTSAQSQSVEEELPNIQVAHLAQHDRAGLDQIQAEFSKRNPGYALDYQAQTLEIGAQLYPQIAFVQEGGGTATLSDGHSSKVSVGDIVWLSAEMGLTTDSLMSFLIFKVPEAPSSEIPHVIRPDWDPNITDIPGGCATETGAYRRILLTWLKKVGAFTYPFLNAHRVRIMDSFSHYHPVDNGFDEFYLVQMVMEDGQILTSNRVDLIENPESVTKDQAQGLFTSTPLQVGDLVYLPRGLIHRGLNGVLAQVITVPGFVPKSEIGVDHHLKKINELLSLEGAEEIPYNKNASDQAIIK